MSQSGSRRSSLGGWVTLTLHTPPGRRGRGEAGPRRLEAEKQRLGVHGWRGGGSSDRGSPLDRASLLSDSIAGAGPSASAASMASSTSGATPPAKAPPTPPLPPPDGTGAALRLHREPPHAARHTLHDSRVMTCMCASFCLLEGGQRDCSGVDDGVFERAAA